MSDEQNKIGPLINVTFKISNGDKYILIFNSNSRINKIENEFFGEIAHKYGIFHYVNRIQFLYNGYEINLNIPFSTIGNFFKNDYYPKIIVNNSNNLINKKIKITFKTNHGYKHEIICFGGKTI